MDFNSCFLAELLSFPLFPTGAGGAVQQPYGLILGKNKRFLQGGYGWGMRRAGVGSSLFLQLLTLLPLCCGDLRCFGSSSFSLSHGPIVSSILVGTYIYFVFPALGSLLFTCSLHAFTLSWRPILPTVYAMMSCVLRLLHSDPIIIKPANFLQVT